MKTKLFFTKKIKLGFLSIAKLEAMFSENENDITVEWILTKYI